MQTNSEPCKGGLPTQRNLVPNVCWVRYKSKRRRTTESSAWRELYIDGMANSLEYHFP